MPAPPDWVAVTGDTPGIRVAAAAADTKRNVPRAHRDLRAFLELLLAKTFP